MSLCWSEGALRTYLDRELPPPDMELVAAHLEECAECAEMSRNLAARAARVAVWMDALPRPEMASETALSMPRPAPARHRWIALAAAIAAGLGLAAMVAPRHGHMPALPQPEVVTPSVPSVAAADVAVAAELPAPRITDRDASPPKLRRPRVRPQTFNDSFLALDNEPIETGVVMRVGVEPGNVQADIVFGQDGRPHAIRLVSARN